VYLGLSVLFFGRGILAAPTDKVVGDAGGDKTIYIWGLSWFPHSIAAATDPLHTDVLWAPHGTDLAWVTDIPGAAVIAWPVTALFGPVVAYNVLVLLAPAASAYTAFLLAHWITRRYWASAVAGYLFGFCSFEILQTSAHLHLTLAFLIPLAVLLVLKHFAGEVQGARFVVLLTLVLAGQFLLSLEMFTVLIFAGGLAAATAWFLVPRHEWPRLHATTLGATASVALALVVVSPYIVHALLVATIAARPVRSPFREATDLLNFVVPNRRTWLRLPGSQALVERFSATGVERGGYLGLPLLLIVAWLGLRRRSMGTTILMVILAVLLIASLGPRIRVAGVETIRGPWLLIARIPVLDAIKPARLDLFVELCAALACGIWLAEGHGGALRWLLASVAIIALLPSPTRALWTSRVPRPTFVSSGAWQRELGAHEVALVLPYGAGGWSLAWQAEAGLRPRLVDGWIGRRVTLKEEPWRDVYQAFAGYPSPAIATRRLRGFFRVHNVATVVILPGTRIRAKRLIARLQWHATHSHDAVVYRPPGGPY
jgi:hypothetical protein